MKNCRVVPLVRSFFFKLFVYNYLVQVSGCIATAFTKKEIPIAPSKVSCLVSQNGFHTGH